MTIRELRDMLEDYPPSATIDLSKLIALPKPTQEQLKDARLNGQIELDPHEVETFELSLDLPIMGIAFNDRENELRFIVEHCDPMSKFGSVRPIVL